MFTKLELSGLVAIAKQTIVSNFHKATRQDMNKKSANKLFRGKSHHLLFAVVFVVPPFEGNRIFFNIDDTLI
ncbi:MAG: hypothetical protein ACYDGZ_17740 [Desulfosporosinus fructosivorans]